MLKAQQYLKRLSAGSSSNNDQSWLQEASSALINSSLQDADHLAVVQSLASGLGRHVAATNRVSILDKAIQLAQVSARRDHFSELDMDGYTIADIATLQNELNALTLDTQGRKAAKSKMSDMLADAAHASNIKERYKGQWATDVLTSSLDRMHKSTMKHQRLLSSRLGDLISFLGEKPMGEDWDTFANDLRDTLRDTGETCPDLTDATVQARKMTEDVKWELTHRPKLDTEDTARVVAPLRRVARVDTGTNAWQEEAADTSSEGQGSVGQRTGDLSDYRLGISAHQGGSDDEEDDHESVAEWRSQNRDPAVSGGGLPALDDGDDASSAWQEEQDRNNDSPSPLGSEGNTGESVVGDDGKAHNNPWK